MAQLSRRLGYHRIRSWSTNQCWSDKLQDTNYYVLSFFFVVSRLAPQVHTYIVWSFYPHELLVYFFIFFHTAIFIVFCLIVNLVVIFVRQLCIHFMMRSTFCSLRQLKPIIIRVYIPGNFQDVTNFLTKFETRIYFLT